MGIHLIIEAESSEAIAKTLVRAAEFVEIFPIREGLFGLSIPRKIVDQFGEGALVRDLQQFRFFDLWAGKWNHPLRSK